MHFDSRAKRHVLSFLALVSFVIFALGSARLTP